ncbi:hypothetical protein [Nocardioides sp. AN3]
MAETTTIDAAFAGEGMAFRVAIEDDASPVVRLIGRTLRDSSRAGHGHDVLSRCVGTVAVRSHDTPQAATITFDRGDVKVVGGVLAHPDANIVVDLSARFAPAQEPTGDTTLAAGTLTALQPPLPHLSVAARQFWDRARVIPGIPDVLVLLADGPDGQERSQYGEGPSTYLMAGPPDVLAGVCSGADDFLLALSTGLRVKGTLAQLSVMTAASWKVRFDV